MIVAVVSDIHTNCAAWEAVRKDMDQYNAEKIWALGDWLGYIYNHPIKLWDSFIDHSDDPLIQDLMHYPEYHCVVGNHDLAILAKDAELDQLRKNRTYKEEAWKVIIRQRNKVQYSTRWKQEFAPWLQAQPYLLSPISGIYLAHGNYTMKRIDNIPFEYTPPKETAEHERWFCDLLDWINCGSDNNDSRLRHLNNWSRPLLLITGHTHTQRVWQRNSVAQVEIWAEYKPGSIPPEYVQACISQRQPVDWYVPLEPTPDAPIWFNPGSVGLPRNDGGRKAWDDWCWAKYAILEWQDNKSSLRLRWVPYPNKEAD